MKRRYVPRQPFAATTTRNDKNKYISEVLARWGAACKVSACECVSCVVSVKTTEKTSISQPLSSVHTPVEIRLRGWEITQFQTKSKCLNIRCFCLFSCGLHFTFLWFVTNITATNECNHSVQCHAEMASINTVFKAIAFCGILTSNIISNTSAISKL